MYIPNFKFLAYFERELCEEQTLKNSKNQPKKKHFLGAERRWNGAEKTRTPKDISMIPTECTFVISSS